MAVLCAAAMVGACSSTGQTGGASMSFAAADPVLPDTVNLIPTGISGDETDGMRSLAREVESSGTVKSAAYAPQVSESAVASLAAMDGEADKPNVVVASLAQEPSGATPLASGPGGIEASPPAPQERITEAGTVEARSGALDQLMAHYANFYGVPEVLVRRVAKRESTFNPRATNGSYLGLMQISLPTARGMGYKGSREGLLDAETNLKYAVRYLRGAFVVAGGDHDKADRLYQSGYYYHAKRAGLLDETGVGTDRKRRRGS